VVGVFPTEAAITRPVGAILLEQNDRWARVAGPLMILETNLAPMLPPAAA
jgi:putative transposase